MTTYATDTFTGDGSTVEFTLTFDYIERDHVTVSRVVKATQLATVLTVIKTGTPTGDEFIWEANNKVKVGTAPTTDQELVIARDTPENDQIVKWADGSYIIAADLNTSDLQWLYGLQELEDKFGSLSTSAIKYFGAIDLTTDAPPASPEGGTFYINTGSGTVLPAWTGIGGDSVVGSEQVIYNGNTSEWEIFKVPSSQAGVLQVQATDPITVDNSDTQRPDIGIKASSSTQDGSMSKEDKAKLDALPGVGTGINLGYTAAADKGTVTNTAGDDATIPFATATNAGLLNEAATPGSGTVQYARQVTDGGVASWAQVAIPPGTIISDTEPGTPADGQLWYRPSNSTLWVWDNGNNTWRPAMEPVPTGGGDNYADGVLPEKAFLETSATIDQSYTITDNFNALSAGPVTIGSSATVTVGAGETWTVAGGGDGILWQRSGTTLSPENAGDSIATSTTAGSANVEIRPDGRIDIETNDDPIVATRYHSGGVGPAIFLQKSKTDTIGGNGLPTNGDTLGVIVGTGNDAGTYRYGTAIEFKVDGTPSAGSTSIPSEIGFVTSALGGPATRGRMRSNGDFEWADSRAVITAIGRGVFSPNAPTFNPGAAGFDETAAIRVQRDYSGGICWRDGTSGTSGAYVAWVDDSGNKFNIAGNINPSTGGASLGVKLENQAAISWSSRSDERDKENLVPITDGLNKVAKLRAVTGNFIEELDPTKERKAFLLAQDVLEVQPEAVSVSNEKLKKNQRYSLCYSEMIPLLVSALHDAKDRIEALEAQLTALQEAN